MLQWITGIVLSLPLVGVYAIFAIGIVLMYRASKVLNLAHGVMATAPAYILYTLSNMRIPLLISLPLAIASGGALGWLVQKLFVHPFRKLGETAQTVGTVVVLGLGIAIMAQLWGASPLLAVAVFPEGGITVGMSVVRYGEIGLFVVMIGLFLALQVLFSTTDFGLLMRGSAENPRAAALMGVNPELMTALSWILGGSLAGLAGIMLAGVTTLHPYSLPLQALPGFLAALLGGLGSITGAVVGGAAVGLVLGLVPLVPGLVSLQGAPQLILAVIGMVVMARRGQTLVATDVRGGIV
jgi:branched-chain amino acid transport system permease protein